MEGAEKYALDLSTPEDPLLRELDRETHLRAVQPRMISGHVQGRLLEMIVRMLRPRNVLEIGTFTGYATLCMAAGLEDGATIDTIEIDDELEALAASFFVRSPHGHRIKQHIGNALDIAPRLGRTYDLVFIDGDKREYPEYWKMLTGDARGGKCPSIEEAIPVRPLVRRGGFVLADNVLWYGKVASEAARGDLHTRRLQEFNEMVAGDPRVENIILPLRDGISIIRIK